MMTLDQTGAPDHVREAFRLAVLTALDAMASRALRVTGVHSPGASDDDLPGLFRAIDAQADRLAVRYGVRWDFEG